MRKLDILRVHRTHFKLISAEREGYSTEPEKSFGRKETLYKCRPSALEDELRK